VNAGEVVELIAARAPQALPSILEATDDLVAVAKPAGIPTIADHEGAAHALVALVAGQMGVDAARLHPTSRLDRDVSGVVVMALTAGASERLMRARQDGAYQRRYVGLATGAPSPPAGAWDAAVGRARDPRLRQVGGPQSQPARTLYATCARATAGEALLALAPQTGRTHQIRVHAAHSGCPLLGDRAYGAPPRITLPTGRVVEPRRVALHALRVAVPDRHGGMLVATAPIPDELRDLWLALGGDGAAWEVASACPLVSP
jgi:23S rRNA-/tRNA-specific pseudouridylate synthase